MSDVAEHALPTPQARDHKGSDPNPRGGDFNDAVGLLPTPVTGSNAKSARTMRGANGDQRTGGGQSGPPGLDEISTMLDGEVPAHMPPVQELGAKARAVVESLLPTPKTKDRAARGPNAGGGPDLGEEVALLNNPSTSEGTGVGAGRRKDSTLRGQVDNLVPTPTAKHASRSRTVERGVNGGTSDPHVGTTLQDWADEVDELLPTPSTLQGGESTRGGDRADEKLLLGIATELFPTPTAEDMGERREVEEYDQWQARMAQRHGNGGHGDSLSVEARRLMPTPKADDGRAGSPGNKGSAGDLTLPSAALELMPTPDSQMGGAGGRSADPDHLRATGQQVHTNEAAQALTDRNWGPYEPAIRRWEAVLGRVAPWATEPAPRSKKGRLSPRFVEWMMGWALGWVTGITALTRNQQLKILGNGVVPQQASEAVRFLLADPPRIEPTKRKNRAPKRATPKGMMRAANKENAA